MPLWFIWIYSFVLKFLKRKSVYQKGNRFHNVSFEACNLPQKPDWNFQHGLPHREQVKTWFGTAWQWLSAPKASIKKKILLPANSACIQLEWKCNRKLDGLKSTCFSFSPAAWIQYSATLLFCLYRSHCLLGRAFLSQPFSATETATSACFFFHIVYRMNLYYLLFVLNLWLCFAKAICF